VDVDGAVDRTVPQKDSNTSTKKLNQNQKVNQWLYIGSVKFIVAQTKVTLAYKLVGDLCILTLISFKFDIHVFQTMIYRSK
jgi:hypothetical protein